MLTGFIFLWTSWFFWIIVFFFMEKNKRRTILSLWILLMIGSAYIMIPTEKDSVTLAFIILFLSSMFWVGQQKRWKYYIVVALTLMIGYTAFLLWAHLSPIWIVLPKLLLEAIFHVFITIILLKGFYERLMIGILGLCAGELLYGILLSSYHFYPPIGQLQTLDQVACNVGLLAIVMSIQFLSKQDPYSIHRPYEEQQEQRKKRSVSMIP